MFDPSAFQPNEPIYIELPPFFLNQSRWKAYQDCDRLYGWLYVEGLQPERPRPYFEVGKAIHAAQVLAHSKGATEEAFKEATEFAEAEFRKGFGAPQLPGDDEEIANQVDTIRRLLPAYRVHYQGRQTWKPLGMELAFCVEVGEGTNVWLVGRIDNLVTFLEALWLVDYKTMAKLDLRNFRQFEIDIQLTAYIYGGTKQLSIDSLAKGGKPVIIRGAIIDGLIKTKIPQFHRELYTRSIDDLRQFEVEFVMKAWEIAAKHCMVRGDKVGFEGYMHKMYELGASHWKIAFPMNTNKCFNYGTCSFRDLCVKDNEVRRLSFVRRAGDYVDEARVRKS